MTASAATALQGPAAEIAKTRDRVMMVAAPVKMAGDHGLFKVANDLTPHRFVLRNLEAERPGSTPGLFLRNVSAEVDRPVFPRRTPGLPDHREGS